MKPSNLDPSHFNRSGRPRTDRAALAFSNAKMDAYCARHRRVAGRSDARVMTVRAYNGLRNALALRDRGAA